MPSWIDYAGFDVGLRVVLHQIAFIRPHGWASRRLYSSFHIDPGDLEYHLSIRRTLASEGIVICHASVSELMFL